MTPTDLKNWRTQQGLSQSELAVVLGVHEITVSRWERGTIAIPPFLHYALWAIEHRAPREPLFDPNGEPSTRGHAVLDSLTRRGLI